MQLGEITKKARTSAKLIQNSYIKEPAKDLVFSIFRNRIGSILSGAIFLYVFIQSCYQKEHWLKGIIISYAISFIGFAIVYLFQKKVSLRIVRYTMIFFLLG